MYLWIYFCPAYSTRSTPIFTLRTKRRSSRRIVGRPEGAANGGSNGETHSISQVPELVTATAFVVEEYAAITACSRVERSGFRLSKVAYSMSSVPLIVHHHSALPTARRYLDVMHTTSVYLETVILPKSVEVMRCWTKVCR